MTDGNDIFYKTILSSHYSYFLLKVCIFTKKKKNIVYSFLGTEQDQRTKNPWQHWRPSVALAMQSDLNFDEYHILYQPPHKELLDRIVPDIKGASPSTKVFSHSITFDNPWDFEQVYAKLYDFCKAQHFTPDEYNYYVHITTGTHVAQICLFLLTESHHFPAKLIQTWKATEKETDTPARGRYAVIDLDLSRYDKIAKRFADETARNQSTLKGGIDTKNKAYNRLIYEIELVARKSQEPILLTGPTGAGKSTLAEKIHEVVMKQTKGKKKWLFRLFRGYKNDFLSRKN